MSETTLYARQGDRFVFEATYESGGSPVDLTGYTAEMVFTWPAFQWPNAVRTEAGEIMVTMSALDSTGVILGELTSAQTSGLPVTGPSRTGPAMTWQLAISAGGERETLATGAVSVGPDFFALVP